MREYDDLRLERLLRETLHAEADLVPLDVSAEHILVRWRSDRRRRSSGRLVVLLVAAAVLLLPLGLLLQGGGRAGVVVEPSSSMSAPPAAFDPAAYPGWIAYSTGIVGPDRSMTEVRLVHADGSEDHGIQVPVVEAWDEAEWAPNGMTLLVARTRLEPNVFDILEYDLATGATRELVPCDAAASTPCAQANEASYSSDGRRIAYFFAEGAVDDGGIPATCGLRIMSIADAITEAVTRHACGLIEDRHPRWSPDGTRLAFYRTRQDVKGGPVTGSALFIRDLARGTETQLTGWEASRAEELDWSPDGEWIAFMDGIPGDRTTGRLSRIRPDGTGLEILHSFGDGVAPFRPRYTPDGAWIFTTDLWGGPDVHQGHLFAIPAGGGSATQFMVEFPGNPFIYGTLQPTP